jgi:LacI family transcriptional regulator
MRKRLRMAEAPNLVEVARRARVSISTVSRTINQTGKISAETQDHVRRVMREMGYKPNRVARRLRAGGKCHLIGLIIPNIQNPFFADLARGVEDVAYRNNFAVLLCNYDEDPAKEKFYLDVMEQESVDGIILPPVHERDPAVLRVAESGMPVVCVDRAITGAAIDKVEIDNHRGAFDAVMHLVERGHKRIGLISGPADSSTGRERLAGYRHALADAGIAVAPDLIRYGDYKQESGRVLADELLGRARPPSALFVSNNLMTIGALEAIATRSLKIPRDVALLSFDDLPLAAVFNPPLTVVRQPAYEVGRSAAEMLFKRLEDPTRPASSLKLLPELVLRAST